MSPATDFNMSRINPNNLAKSSNEEDNAGSAIVWTQWVWLPSPACASDVAFPYP